MLTIGKLLVDVLILLKVLGVYIDDKLNFKLHVNVICRAMGNQQSTILHVTKIFRPC